MTLSAARLGAGESGQKTKLTRLFDLTFAAAAVQ
jgi:hypothetical protein